MKKENISVQPEVSPVLPNTPESNTPESNAVQSLNLTKLFERNSESYLDNTKKAFSVAVTSVLRTSYADYVTTCEKKVCALLNAQGYDMSKYQCGGLAELLAKDEEKAVGLLASALMLRGSFRLFAEGDALGLHSLAKLVQKHIKALIPAYKSLRNELDTFYSLCEPIASNVTHYCVTNDLPYTLASSELAREVMAQADAPKDRTKRNELAEAIRKATQVHTETETETE